MTESAQSKDSVIGKLVAWVAPVLAALAVVAQVEDVVTRLQAFTLAVSAYIGSLSIAVWIAAQRHPIAVLSIGPTANLVQYRFGGWRVALAFTASLFCAAAIVWQPVQAMVGLARLRAIERQFVTEYRGGDQTAIAFPDLIRRANQRVFDAANSVRQAQQEGKKDGTITFVMGSGGSGKDVIRKLLKQDDPDLLVTTLGPESSQSDFNRVWKTVKIYTPDLTWRNSDGRVEQFSQLGNVPNLDEKGVRDILRIPTHGDAPIRLLVDELDEVHPKLAKEILIHLDRIITTEVEKGRPMHVWVLGRPEAFSGYLTDERLDRKVRPSLIPVEPIKCETRGTGDELLEDWRRKVAHRPLPLAPGTHDIFAGWLRDYPWLRYTIGNVACMNGVADRAANDPRVDEAGLKTAVLSRLFDRAAEKHLRPQMADSRYYTLFENIAEQYMSVDPRGFFSVEKKAFVPVTNANGSFVGEVSVVQVLDRSGLVLLDPADSTFRRYRFEPFWLHSHLAMRRIAQTMPFYRHLRLEVGVLSFSVVAAIIMAPIVGCAVSFWLRRRTAGCTEVVRQAPIH